MPTDQGALLTEPNVKLQTDEKDFTYLCIDGTWVVTGLSKTGFKKFRQYGVNDYVEITLPKTVYTSKTKGVAVRGYLNIATGEEYPVGKDDYCDYFPLKDLLTRGSAYLKIVCPSYMREFYGVKNYSAGEYGFKLREVDLGTGIRLISDGAFSGLTGITKLKIPASVTEIGERAFKGCTNLSFEALEVGGIKVGSHAFEGITIELLTASYSIYNGESVRSISTAPFAGANIKKIAFEDEVSYIPPYYFAGAYFTAENDIMLNEVVSIDRYAFATCYDLNIWLTTDIWEVDDTAFANCNRLHAVVKYGSPAYTSLKKAGFEFDEVH